MGSEFHKGKRFIQEVLKVVQAGLAENATPEDRETMALLLSDDLEVSGGMMDSIMQVAAVWRCADGTGCGNPHS